MKNQIPVVEPTWNIDSYRDYFRGGGRTDGSMNVARQRTQFTTVLIRLRAARRVINLYAAAGASRNARFGDKGKRMTAAARGTTNNTNNNNNNTAPPVFVDNARRGL